MNITPILQAAFALLAAIVTAFVVPYIKSRTTAEQQAQLNSWVQIAVAAAEQIYTGPGRGAEKKDYVLLWLREHGVEVDSDKLNAMVEAAVYDLKYGIIPTGSGVLLEGEVAYGDG